MTGFRGRSWKIGKGGLNEENENEKGESTKNKPLINVMKVLN